MAAATKESFARALEGLVRKFDADRETYLSPGYGEAQARSHFITPFFKALGWDVENEAGVPYHLCDVWEEKGETEGRPDYTFRVGGQTKFFVEAKAPSVPLSNVAHILQTKRYAWNSREIFFAGLTDFEEFLFFDASLEPDEKRPRDGEAFDLQYTKYQEKIDLLWELSKERVAAGSLAQFLRRDRKSIRYRIPVDKRFLDELTEWRLDLARSIHSQNRELDPRLVNEVVQRLLDRIVFIRIAEDRKVIEARQLWDIADLWEESGGRRAIMEFLVDLFGTINNDFNGEIFKPHACEKVKLESSVMAKIIRRLYPPRSPYRFDVIGVELLGSIYERYLGNTLHVTAKQVRIEPKPEVRKAGGVYYTPQFVVDYIVKNTVGNLVEGKTPKEAQKLRILDPACGSGSFLIGAFQYLMDWHLNYYREHLREARLHPMYPQVVSDLDGTLRLSFHAKTRIMRQNLYGVDLDPQAVEITMMSLYLKALEGEKGMLAPRQEVLPELKYNIRCGNSLIGPDIERETPLTAEEGERIRPFDWNSREESFGDILAAGGFDAVVGNPPYIRIQSLRDTNPKAADYLSKNYVSSRTGNFDIYVCFVERGFSLLRRGGRFGFILPNKFLQTDYGVSLRELLLKEKAVEAILDFGASQVFDGPTTYTCLLFLHRNGGDSVGYARVAAEASALDRISFDRTSLNVLSEGPWVLAGGDVSRLYERLRKLPKLIDVARISRGSSSGDDYIFVVQETSTRGQFRIRTGERVRLEEEIVRIPIYATDFARFRFAPAATDRIIFPYKRLRDGFKLFSEGQLRKNYPRTYAYLLSQKQRLTRRKQFRSWFGFSAARNLDLHDQATMIVPLLADRASFAPFPGDSKKYCPMASGGFTLGVLPEAKVHWPFVLGVLNSRAAFWFLRQISNVFRGGWITCTKQYIGQVPVPLHATPNQQQQITRLVKKRIGVHSEQEIPETEAEIDEVVYELYGITAKERKVMEQIASE
jgi:hypothetical protein